MSLPTPIGNIRGPEGPTGPTGSQGPTGSTGAKGDTGLDAAQLPIPCVAFDGDSLTYGAGSFLMGEFPFGGDYPSQVVQSLDPRGSYHNAGLGGETISTMLANAAINVDVWYTEDANSVVIICGGSNDIVATDSSPYDLIVAYCQARRAVGWKVIVGTIGPRYDLLDAIPADFEAVRLACNAQIVANWESFADGLADWGSDPQIGTNLAPYTALDLKYYAGDGAHLNWLGYSIRASYALKELAKLGIIGELGRQQLIPDKWIPAKDLYILEGPAVLGIIPGTVHQAWKLPHGSDTSLAGECLVPAEWATYYACPAYARAPGAVASGGFGLSVAYYAALAVFNNYFTAMPGAGTVFAGIGNVGGLTQALQWLPPATELAPPAGSVYSPGLIALPSENGVYPRMVQKVAVKRIGTDATDTCSDDMYLLGVYLFRAS